MPTYTCGFTIHIRSTIHTRVVLLNLASMNILQHSPSRKVAVICKKSKQTEIALMRYQVCSIKQINPWCVKPREIQRERLVLRSRLFTCLYETVYLSQKPQILWRRSILHNIFMQRWYMFTEIVNLNHTKIDSETHKLKTNIKRMLMSMVLKVFDHVKKFLKTMLVEILGPDVS